MRESVVASAAVVIVIGTATVVMVASTFTLVFVVVTSATAAAARVGGLKFFGFGVTHLEHLANVVYFVFCQGVVEVELDAIGAD